MLLVKDNRPKAHRKLFPVYFKCPEKVILEYTSIVYTKDWLGRVRKHSKNNVKKAGTRTIRMFNNLSSLGRYVFGSEISYNKAPPRLPGLAY